MKKALRRYKNVIMAYYESADLGAPFCYEKVSVGVATLP